GPTPVDEPRRLSEGVNQSPLELRFRPLPVTPYAPIVPLCNRPKNYYVRVEGVAQRNGQPSQVQLPRNIRHRHELFWGCLLLTSITYALARERGVAPLPEIAKHLWGDFFVIVTSRLFGAWIREHGY